MRRLHGGYREWVAGNSANRTTVRVGIVGLAFALFLSSIIWDEHSLRAEAESVSKRASVFVDTPYLIYNADGRNSATVYLSIQNGGPTVAKDVSWELGLNVLDRAAGYGTFNGLTEGAEMLREGPTILAPAGRLGSFLERQVLYHWPSDEAQRTGFVASVRERPSTDKSKSIFLFGRVIYRDEFRGSATYTFCRMYDGPETDDRQMPGEDFMRWNYHPRRYTPCPGKGLNDESRQIS